MYYSQLLQLLTNYDLTLFPKHRSMLYWMIRDMEAQLRAHDIHIESKLCWCVPTVEDYTVNHAEKR